MKKAKLFCSLCGTTKGVTIRMMGIKVCKKCAQDVKMIDPSGRARNSRVRGTK